MSTFKKLQSCVTSVAVCSSSLAPNRMIRRLLY